MLRHTVRLGALAVVVLGGLVQGHWSGRWSQSLVLNAAVSHLDLIPENVGDWQSLPLTLDRKQIEIGEIAGHSLRVYKNRRTGEELKVLVVCGRPGPISVHTPDVCFSGAGYETIGAPTVERISFDPTAKPGSFQTALFRKDSAEASSTLRAYWAWNVQEKWEAPENPRLAFAPFRVLYKMYVIREVPSPKDRLEESVCRDFIQQFLPLLDRILFVPVSKHASLPLDRGETAQSP